MNREILKQQVSPKTNNQNAEQRYVKKAQRMQGNLGLQCQRPAVS